MKRGAGLHPLNRAQAHIQGLSVTAIPTDSLVGVTSASRKNNAPRLKRWPRELLNVNARQRW